MITLQFGGINAIHDKRLGPAEGFRVSGNFMRQMPQETVVAQYARHQWHIEDRAFARYDCRDPAVIHFEDVERQATHVFGPFEHVIAADGTMYADGALFAKFVDETLLWHSFKLETFWPNLVIRSAEKA